MRLSPRVGVRLVVTSAVATIPNTVATVPNRDFEGDAKMITIYSKVASTQSGRSASKFTLLVQMAMRV